jgi:CRISPR-associated endonuclease/helicase Cas3
LLTADVLPQTFAALTGGKKQPYGYQLRVAGELLDGKNVLLRAPTGAGKTLAALLPYIAARRVGNHYVDRILYALPLRTLATSLWQSTCDLAQQAGLNPVSNPPPAGEGPSLSTLRITLQTGEQQDDPYFLGDIVFTTIDQLLSGYLNIPVSLSKRAGNMTGGALTGALVVLDEVHLLEPGKSLATAVDLAIRLRNLTQCLWMTATMSAQASEILRTVLNAELIDVPASERQKMPAQRDKERQWNWTGKLLDADQVLSHHRGGRTIALCNTVKRAQKLYEDVEVRKTPGTRVYLLHSRFFRKHRKRTEGQLAALFGPDATEQDAILISTQVVEAGIDISADVLHTELCPANSLLQRAGRCARYPGERGKGVVYVYEIANTRPYTTTDQVKTIDDARTALIRRSGCILDADQEQELVDSVHGHIDARIFKEVCVSDRVQHGRRIVEAMNDGEGSKVRELIRDVNSLNLILHANPARDLPDLHRMPETIGVPRVSLFMLEPIFDEMAPGGEIAWVPDDAKGDMEQQGGPGIIWRSVGFKELYAAPYLAVLHPCLATYSEAVGLLLGKSGTIAPPLQYQSKQKHLYGGMHCETWLQHAERTLAEGRRLRNHSSEAYQLFDRILGVSTGTTAWLCDLACVLHDTGKLRTDWQHRIRLWQMHKNAKAAPLLTGQPLAHSDYLSGDRQLSRQAPYGPLPAHSMEGAYAIASAVRDSCVARIADVDVADACTRAVISAIGRHHGAYAKTLASFGLVGNAASEVHSAATLADPHNLIPWRVEDNPDQIDCVQFTQDGLVSAGEDAAYHLYRFIVRYLRLADTRSLESQSGE